MMSGLDMGANLLIELRHCRSDRVNFVSDQNKALHSLMITEQTLQYPIEASCFLALQQMRSILLFALDKVEEERA